MARAHHVAETSATRFSAAGGVGVVLRFGWLYGPSARQSEAFLALARQHLCVMLGPPHTSASTIHVADACAAVAAALTIPAGTYTIVDDEPVTQHTYANARATAAGREVCLKILGRLALLFGDRTTSLMRSLRASNACFRKASGRAPRYPMHARGLDSHSQCSRTASTGVEWSSVVI